ncbi:hypothetical protein [Nocardia sp. NPDC046763]|uniref:hypothetical protein n=1 Tax=Nocardia sp. NPDC046763 TaxID=3155256 RepID=UPI0034109416
MSISQYSKTAISISGGVVAWGTETATLLELVPDKRAAAVAAALLFVVHSVQSFGVWLTKNEPMLEQVAAEAEAAFSPDHAAAS